LVLLLAFPAAAVPTAPADVYSYDLDTGETSLVSGAGSALLPSSGGRYIVWSDDRDVVPGFSVYGWAQDYNIHGYDTVLDQEFVICDAPYAQSRPVISGNIVLWDDCRRSDPSDEYGAQCDIMGYDLSTGKEFPVFVADVSAHGPAIDGDVVVWVQGAGVGSTNIYGMRLSRGEPFPICTAPDYQEHPDVSGDFIVWEDSRNASTTGTDIYGYDLVFGQEFAVCLNDRGQQSPSIDGDLVAWVDYRYQAPGNSKDIFGIDLTAMLEFPIVVAPGYQTHPQVSGRTVVWEDYDDASDTDIFGASMPEASELTAVFGPSGGDEGLFAPLATFPVAVGPGNQWSPSVGGGLVAYSDDGGLAGPAIPEPAAMSILAAGCVVLRRRFRRSGQAA